MGFVSFMISATGRWIRVIAGFALIVGGLLLVTYTASTAWGIAFALVGFVPLFAGMFDVCMLAPLFGEPFSGPNIRARVHAH